MLAYIQQNYEKKLSLEDIAGAAFVGKRECLRCFQSCMGKDAFRISFGIPGGGEQAAAAGDEGLRHGGGFPDRLLQCGLLR